MSVRHFIDGEWTDSADGATFESVSPIDNTVIAQVARGGAADADRAVDAARHAFDHGPWPTMSPADRKKILHAAAALIEERLEEFAAAGCPSTAAPAAVAASSPFFSSTSPVSLRSTPPGSVAWPPSRNPAAEALSATTSGRVKE